MVTDWTKARYPGLGEVSGTVDLTKILNTIGPAVLPAVGPGAGVSQYVNLASTLLGLIPGVSTGLTGAVALIGSIVGGSDGARAAKLKGKADTVSSYKAYQAQTEVNELPQIGYDAAMRFFNDYGYVPVFDDPFVGAVWDQFPKPEPAFGKWFTYWTGFPKGLVTGREKAVTELVTAGKVLDAGSIQYVIGTGEPLTTTLTYSSVQRQTAPVAQSGNTPSDPDEGTKGGGGTIPDGSTTPPAETGGTMKAALPILGVGGLIVGGIAVAKAMKG